MLGFAIWLFVVFSKKVSGRLLWVSAAGFIIVNIFLTNGMYVPLLRFQGGSQAGRYIRTHSISPGDVVLYKPEDAFSSVHFYAQGIIDATDNLPGVQNRKYVLTMDKGLDELKQSGRPFDIEKQGQLFKVSELTPEFLNPEKRKNEVKNYYLLKLK